MSTGIVAHWLKWTLLSEHCTVGHCRTLLVSDRWTLHSCTHICTLHGCTLRTGTVGHCWCQTGERSVHWTLLWIPLDTALIETFPRLTIIIIIHTIIGYLLVHAPRILGSQDPRIPGSRDPRLLGSWDPEILGFKNPKILAFRDPRILGFWDSEILGSYNNPSPPLRKRISEKN